jgi:hypothetical protein
MKTRLAWQSWNREKDERWQLTRELGVSGSVSDSLAEGEVGRSDILGAAFSEKSATYFRSINDKNPPTKSITQCREWSKTKHTVIMKKHGERKKNARKLSGFTEARKGPESILEVKIFSDVAGMGMQRAGWLFS